MEFKKAYEALKQGALIKCPEWRGYWKWEDNSIKMHCKDGKTLDIRETKNVGYTLDFILRDDWEIVDEADVKDLDVQTFTFGEAIRRLKIESVYSACNRYFICVNRWRNCKLRA